MTYRKKQHSEEREKQEEKAGFETVLEIPEAKLEEIRAAARERVQEAHHKWVQRGTRLVCTSCPYPHSVHIGTRYRMIGVDEEGKPVLKARGKE